MEGKNRLGGERGGLGNECGEPGDEKNDWRDERGGLGDECGKPGDKKNDWRDERGGLGNECGKPGDEKNDWRGERGGLGNDCGKAGDEKMIGAVSAEDWAMSAGNPAIRKMSSSCVVKNRKMRLDFISASR